MEDTLWWKRTFDGRQHSMDDDLRQKTAFDGRRSLGDALTPATVWPFLKQEHASTKANQRGQIKKSSVIKIVSKPKY